MLWKNIKLIFLREVRDQLRDRRTLFIVAVLPLLLYPLLGIGMVQMLVAFAEQPRRVAIIGSENLPEPPLVIDNHFDPRFFDVASDAEKLTVCTPQGELPPDLTPQLESQLRQFFADVEDYLPKIARLGEIQTQLKTLSDPAQSAALESQEQQLREEIDRWFSDAPVQVLLIFPSDFRERYREISSLAEADRQRQVPENALSERLVILHNSADEKSDVAFQRIRRAVRNWEEVLLTQRLHEARLPETFPHPVPLTDVDLAEAEQVAANLWSKAFPALLILMSLTGAFYPAIDLGAGEKERGTMETLLISPASRTEIVAGKFLTVLLFSITTALLNLVSMGFTGRHMVSAVGAAKSSPIGDLSFPPFSSLAWVILLAIPIAALFSALSLSLAMFARSTKEGQYYLSPLLLVTVGMVLFCLNPGVELTPYYSVLPVVGPALLLKTLLLGNTAQSNVLLYAVPVLFTSCVYSVLALWWAIEQFQREDVLFREAERLDLRLWIRHLLREKEETPGFAEAAVCFVIITLAMFLFITSMQGSVLSADSVSHLLVVQAVSLVATVGMPPLMMAILLTSNPWKTLKLRWPRRWSYWPVSIILALTLQPLVLEMMARLDRFFPPLPPGTEELIQAMGNGPLWLSLIAFAVAPAICEELAFRGFILTGLQRTRHHWRPVLISAMLFGIIHGIPKQQFNAALMGIVLALLAVRSGSLLPGILFHFIFNGTQVLAAQISNAQIEESTSGWWITTSNNGDLHFTSLTLILCALIAGPLIYWLGRKRTTLDSVDSPDPPNQNGATGRPRGAENIPS